MTVLAGLTGACSLDLVVLAGIINNKPDGTISTFRSCILDLTGSFTLELLILVGLMGSCTLDPTVIAGITGSCKLDLRGSAILHLSVLA